MIITPSNLNASGYYDFELGNWCINDYPNTSVKYWLKPISKSDYLSSLITEEDLKKIMDNYWDMNHPEAKDFISELCTHLKR